MVSLKEAAGSRRSEGQGDLFVSDVGGHQNDTEEGRESFGQVKAPPQKKGAVIRVESAETQEYCVSAPADESLGSRKKFRSESHVGPCTCVMTSVELQVLRNSGYCVRRRCSAHDSLVQAVLQRKATEARRRRRESTR